MKTTTKFEADKALLSTPPQWDILSDWAFRSKTLSIHLSDKLKTVVGIVNILFKNDEGQDLSPFSNGDSFIGFCFGAGGAYAGHSSITLIGLYSRVYPGSGTPAASNPVIIEYKMNSGPTANITMRNI